MFYELVLVSASLGLIIGYVLLTLTDIFSYFSTVKRASNPIKRVEGSGKMYLTGYENMSLAELEHQKYLWSQSLEYDRRAKGIVSTINFEIRKRKLINFISKRNLD